MRQKWEKLKENRDKISGGWILISLLPDSHGNLNGMKKYGRISIPLIFEFVRIFPTFPPLTKLYRL